METPAKSPAAGGSSDKAAARRLKKRELDRKAQRVARERTKSRIAHLEALVEHFQTINPNSELSQLTSQLSDITEQRDALLNVLRSIDCTIRRHLHTASSSSQRLSLNTSSTKHEPTMVSTPPDSSIDVPNAGRPSHPPPVLPHLQQQHSPPSTSSCILGNSPPTMSGSWQNGAEFDSSLPVPPAVVGQLTDGSSAGQAMVPIGWPTATSCCSTDLVDDVIVPSPREFCDCAASLDTETTPTLRSTWRAANSALGKITKLTRSQLLAEDFTSEDTPIRAILEGWDSVERSGKMSLSWRKLRMIDETCFHSCGQIERLAVLSTMHLLLTYHGDPTPERQAMLPPWLWARPTQMQVPHSYAIDFFVWPGIRERFVYEQHQYCSNLFWELFRLCLHIQWPYDFNDCYSLDPETGRFKLTHLFDRCTRDINSWRMKPDFFAQFPVLSSDIPVSQGLPIALPLTTENKVSHKHQREDIEEDADTSALYRERRDHKNDENPTYISSPPRINCGDDQLVSPIYPGPAEGWEDVTLAVYSAWSGV